MSSVEFKPMGVGDILDTALRLYRHRFGTFLIIALVTYVPYSLLMAAAVTSQPEPLPGQPPEPSVFAIITSLLFVLVVFPLCQGAMVHCISGSYLGESIGAWDSYRRAAPRLLALVGTNILVTLVIGIGFMLLIVPGIIFSLWFIVVTMVVMLEGKSGTAAMGRSKALMKDNLNKGFTLMFVVGLLTIVFSIALQFGMAMVPWPSQFIQELIQTVIMAIILPFSTAVPILLYYDLRIRKEAFDLEILASMIEGDGNEAIAPQEQEGI